MERRRQLESRVPTLSLVHCDVGFARATAWDDAALRAFVAGHGFAIAEMSSSLDAATQTMTYELVMWSGDARAPSRLARALLDDPAVLGFRVTPGRD